MQSKFLDYYKLILYKVSFDRQLLTKEYRKALRRLTAREIDDLHNWLDATGLSTPLFMDTVSYEGRRHMDTAAVELRESA